MTAYVVLWLFFSCFKSFHRVVYSDLSNYVPIDLNDIGVCSSSPCENGGTCSNEGSLFTCKCTANYTGNTCQIKQGFMSCILSVPIIEPFKLAFTDLHSEEAKVLLKDIKGKLTELLSNHIEEFHRLDSYLLRKHNGDTVVEVLLITLAPLASYEAGLHREELMEDMKVVEALVKQNKLSGYTVPASGHITLSHPTTASNRALPVYVFTLVMFILEDSFTPTLYNLESMDSVQLIDTMEMLMNELYKGNIEGFQFGFQFARVNLLRNMQSQVGVCITVVSLSTEDTFNSTLIRTGVTYAFTMLLTNGIFEPYKVQFTGPHDITVDTPYIGSPPQSLMHVFIRLSLNILTDFLEAYVDLDSKKTQKLTRPIIMEMSRHLDEQLEHFEVLDVVIIRALGSSLLDLELEVISLWSEAAYDDDTVKTVVDVAINAAIQTGMMEHGMLLGDIQPSVIKTPPFREHYIITLASVTFAEQFSMVHTSLTSNASMLMKSHIEEEVNNFLSAEKIFKFARLIVLREENLQCVVDLLIACINTVESFDPMSIQQLISDAVYKAIEDGELGGYRVIATSVTVGKPIIDKLPPFQGYAVSVGSMHLDTEWKNTYYIADHPDTQKLIYAVDTELEKAFDEDGHNPAEVNITELREKEHKVDVYFHVASLVVLDDFNPNLTEKSVEEIIAKTVEDGDIGGYGVNPTYSQAFSVYQPSIGAPPASVLEGGDKGRDVVQSDSGNKGGTPMWKTTLFVGLGCVAGAILAVVIVFLFVRSKVNGQNTSGSTGDVAGVEESRAGAIDTTHATDCFECCPVLEGCDLF